MINHCYSPPLKLVHRSGKEDGTGALLFDEEGKGAVQYKVMQCRLGGRICRKNHLYFGHGGCLRSLLIDGQRALLLTFVYH